MAPTAYPFHPQLAVVEAFGWLDFEASPTKWAGYQGYGGRLGPKREVGGFHSLAILIIVDHGQSIWVVGFQGLSDQVGRASGLWEASLAREGGQALPQPALSIRSRH